MRRLMSLAALALVACEKPADAPALDAKFGVFFGGQVQEREQLPLVLDRTRQSHGIRLDFREPPAQPLRVAWEIEKPASAKLEDAGKLVEYGETRTRPGEERLEIPLAFRQNDRPGDWRVRVTVAERVVLDRPFRVVPPGPPPRSATDD
ncbi:MAG TPA: hypothetical protein VFZ53_24070 [Polyangiaceae bacterium]